MPAVGAHYIHYLIYSSRELCEVDTIIIPILKIRGLRLRFWTQFVEQGQQDLNLRASFLWPLTAHFMNYEHENKQANGLLIRMSQFFLQVLGPQMAMHGCVDLPWHPISTVWFNWYLSGSQGWLIPFARKISLFFFFSKSGNLPQWLTSSQWLNHHFCSPIWKSLFCLLHTAWVWIPASLFTNCLILGRRFNLLM